MSFRLFHYGIALVASALCASCAVCVKPSTGSSDKAAAPISQSQMWEPDLGNGKYQNPILHADYSDPDVIRVGSTYYMVSSSFNSSPALPLMQSSDMTHWKIVGHALQRLVPADVFATPQHGKGVWAPCLRFHDGKFWIFYPDPDFGIYVITAKNFSGPWTTPHLLAAGKGLIDPTPLWDDDGKAWLLHAWAKSRAGFNNQLTLKQMASDASHLLDTTGKLVVDGNALPGYSTLEGPKLYKRNGYYYIFAPAGGVETGWQSVFRSKNITGPYEDKIVLTQGASNTNGPHQGAWVQTPEGTDWFFHFQDKKAYGRIVHLQPMLWKNDWPVIGTMNETTGIGEPVAQWHKPINVSDARENPPTSDDFSSDKLGLQWQWNANWQDNWYSLTAHPGYLRLYTHTQTQATTNLWNTPAILFQKLPATDFTVDTQLNFQGHEGDRAGLILYGMSYAWIGLEKHQGQTWLVLVTCMDAAKGNAEKVVERISLNGNSAHLRLVMKPHGVSQFYFSQNGKIFSAAGKEFTAAPGRWVGAKIGLFSVSGEHKDKNEKDEKDEKSYSDFSSFTFSH